MYPRAITWPQLALVATLLGPIAPAAATCYAQPAANLSCGLAGKLKYNAQETWPLYLPQVVRSTDECASLCGRRRASKYSHIQGGGNCHSFRFDAGTGLCQLGNAPVNRSVLARPGSSELYYDGGCFECGDYCVQGFGAQLLDNGAFQQDLLGPWSAYRARVGHGEDGQRFYRCAARDDPGYHYYGRAGSCSLQQKFNICPGHLYKLVFDYLITIGDSPKTAYLNVGFGSGSHVESRNTDPTAWMTQRLYHRATAAETGAYFDPLTFSFEGNSYSAYDGHELVVDNVRVMRAADLSVAAGATNLFENGGFEDDGGSLAPWDTSKRIKQGDEGNFTVVSPGLDGSKHALRFIGKRGHFETPILRQTVRTRPSAKYLFKYQAETVGDKADGWQVFFDIGAPENYVRHSVFVGSGSFDYSIPLQVATNQTFLKLHAESHGSPDSLTLDNIQLLEADES